MYRYYIRYVGYPAEVGALFTTVSSIRVSRVGTYLYLYLYLLDYGPASSSAFSGVHVVTIVPIIFILETIDSLCINYTGWQAVP